MKIQIAFLIVLSIVAILFSQIPTADIIPSQKHALAKVLLANEGIHLPSDAIVGMAFAPDAIPHSRLIVIHLDSSLNPVKTIYPLSPSFYAELMKDAVAISENKSLQKRTMLVPDKKHDEKGRVYFMVTTGIRTLALYPAGFSTLLGDSADGRTVTGLSLLTFGSSLYGSYRFTQNRELGYGRVAMMNYGGELAATYAFLVSRFLYGSVRYKPTITDYTYQTYDVNGHSSQRVSYSDTIESKTPGKIFAVGAMLGFPLGIYAGSRTNLAGNRQYGNADIMRFLGRSAWLYGYLLPLYGSGDDKYDYHLATSCLTMGLIPSGIYLGHKLVKDRDYSSGRGLFIETSGIMGGLTGLLVPTLFKTNLSDLAERRIIITSIMAGHALGTVFGFKYKEQNAYSFFQGGFMAFSAACGGALGLSFPFLAKADSSNPYIIAGLLGSWGGLMGGEYLAKSLFESDARDQRLSQVTLSLPVIYQWPLLFQKSRETDSRVEIVRAGVIF